MECPGLSLHIYHELEDETRCYPINPAVIRAIRDRGWRVVRKLAEGSISDVFVVERNGLEAVLIILANAPQDQSSNYNIEAKLQQAQRFPNIFPEIYDNFRLNIAYSLDPDYRSHIGDTSDRTIQVIEKMDATLGEYLESVLVDYPTLIPEIVNNIRSTLVNYVSTLYNNGITYTDIKLDNIGVNNTDTRAVIKLIDIEGIHLERWPDFDPVDAINRLIDYEIVPLINET